MGTISAAVAILLFTLKVCYGSPMENGFTFAPFEKHIQDLLNREEYDGATIGVIQNGRLIYADGFGTGPDNLPLDVNTPLPASSLSKTLTATAILTLIQDGWLELDDKVFGGYGLLSELEYSVGDKRMLDITVEHLLRHSGGWDEHKPPYYDPMLNRLFLARGYSVEDIEEIEQPEGSLNHYDIIRYVTKQRLAFTPGTEVHYSNFGYCLLGRIIEEVSDIPYEEYVHKHILQKVGMMNTRIGDAFAIPEVVDSEDSNAMVEIDSQLIHGLISPELLDSTLGWYSTVHDISRLAINLMYPSNNQLLKTETLELMFSGRDKAGRDMDSPAWFGLGIHVRNDGAFWQESDHFDNDGIVYHIGLRGFIKASRKDDREIIDQDFTFIMMTTNNRLRKLKSAMEHLVPLVKEWPMAIMPDRAIDELKDIHIQTATDDVLIKKQLPEQHLIAYTNALRQSHYAPTWMHGYHDGDTTHFVVISRKQKEAKDLDFKLEVSNHVRKLRTRIERLEFEEGYKVSLVQNYISSSHYGDLTHLVLMNKNINDSVEIRWGLHTKIQSFLKLVSKRSPRGYRVVAQSVSAPNHLATVDYILHRGAPSLRNPSFSSYHDLTLEQLEEVAKTNAARENALEYLDTHHSANDDTQLRFSAVFQESKKSKWILQIGVKSEDLGKETEAWQARGYTPRIMVGYYVNSGLHYASLWRM